MKPGARVQAAIDILEAFEAGPRPVERMLKDWGRKNRYAGSKDRRAIGEFVFSVMRKRGELAHQMGSASPRALMIGLLASSGEETWSVWFDGSTHAPAALTPDEEQALAKGPGALPRAAKLNLPDWLLSDIDETFAHSADAAMIAMNGRAAVDLRVNILRTTREDAMSALLEEDIAVQPMSHAPLGLRVTETGRHVNVENTQAFKTGLIEVQDEGSQLAAAIAGATPGEQVIDLCAGAGGKTLALAAAMGNHGQIFACDTGGTKLKNMKPRLARAGVRCVQVRKIDPWTPAPGETDMDFVELEGAADLVFLDVPCSGSGTWRRHPDAKWRLTEKDLETYCAAQASILRRASVLVKPGGRMVYVTCSVLARENRQQIESFLASDDDFKQENIDASFAGIRLGKSLQMAPHVTGTDGFFVAVLRKAS